MELTKGSIEAFYNGNDTTTTKAIVQITSIVAFQAGNATRYRVVISDGVRSMEAMLTSNSTPLIDAGELIIYSIVCVTDAICNELQRKKSLIILGLEVLSRHSRVIGNPRPMESSTTKRPNSVQPIGNNSIQPSKISTPLSQQTVARPTYPSSQSSQSSQHSSSIYPISALNPYQTRWKIKGRITRKSSIKHFRNGQRAGKFFCIHVLDNTAEIKATAFNTQADRLFPLFEPGKVYYISKGRVSIARKQLSTVNHEYEVILDDVTEIELCADDADVPQQNYNFTKIADFRKMEKGAVADVIGIVREDHGLHSVMKKGTVTVTNRRELCIVDDTKMQITLSVWEKDAETINFSGQPIVACKGVRVNDFNGRSLSLALDGTITIEPNTAEARKLREWYTLYKSTTEFASFTEEYKAFERRRTEVLITLSAAKKGGLGTGDRASTPRLVDYFSTRVTVAFIRSESMAYPSCPDCVKKLVQDLNGWFCDRCNKPQVAPEWKYIPIFIVQDASSQAYMNCFDDIAQEMIGIPANQLMHLKATDRVAYQAKINDALFRTWILRVRAKTDAFNDTRRVKFHIIEVRPVDYAEQARSIAMSLDHVFASR
ncbi:Replication factor A protein 1 [Apophysomyces ossiformis]|uniref:Replication protein A subunit n=1 Tax=Apophysomyces ossiformis TaxID=679940 RepID=A0A8H7BMM5_9FUNG|nr:Replication factor A protein 1 [Apophysomyces ossiformis]